jgi:DNA-binding Lrp family transcriptional regulator
MPNDVKTEEIQPVRESTRPLDGFDRKILGVLARDAALSYAELGELVGLSAPAVHDRVKKLRSSGRIRSTVALLNGEAIGKPVLAFVQVDACGWGKTEQFESLAELPEVEEIHCVAGDTCMLLKARCASSRALEGLLARIYAIPGVSNTRTYIVLSTSLERTTQGEITEELEYAATVRAVS